MQGLKAQIFGAFLVFILLGGAGASMSASGMIERTYAGTSPNLAAFFFWFLSVGQASCSITIGVCTMPIANEGTNSSYDLVLSTSDCTLLMVIAKNNTNLANFNGTTGGQVANGLPHLTNVLATCTVPTSKASLESDGAVASGAFYMKLVRSLGSLSAGTWARVQIFGSWIASPPTTTSTLTSTVTKTTTSVQPTTIIQTTSSTRTMTEKKSQTLTVIQTTTTFSGSSTSAIVSLYSSAALLGVGVAIATLFLARRTAKR